MLSFSLHIIQKNFARTNITTKFTRKELLNNLVLLNIANCCSQLLQGRHIIDCSSNASIYTIQISARNALMKNVISLLRDAMHRTQHL